MGQQTEIPVPAEPDADVAWLDLALTLWGARKSARSLARRVADDRWELEVLDPGPAPLAMPPVRAAGRTRSECLRAASAAARESLHAHRDLIARHAELVACRRADVDGVLGKGA